MPCTLPLAQASLDRPHLYLRLFARYADAAPAATAPSLSAPASLAAATAGDGATIPTARAVALLSALRGENAAFTSEGAAAASVATAAIASGGSDSAITGSQSAARGSPSVSTAPVLPTVDAIVISPAAAAARARCGYAVSHPPRSLTPAQFTAFLSAGCADLSNSVVVLGCAELFGVRALSPAACEALSALYDRIAASTPSRGGSILALSAKELAAISSDIGFSSDIVRAEACVTDAVARPLPAAAAGATPLTRAEFVDYMAGAAAAAQIDDTRIEDYLRIYYILHMSGIREAAGAR